MRRAARKVALVLGLALVANLVLPSAGSAREPREPRKPGEARSSQDDGGPSARSGNASASNSISGVPPGGHVSQRTSVSTGDVVVGSTVQGTPDGTTSGGSDGAAPPEPTPTVAPSDPPPPAPTPADAVLAREGRIHASPASSRTERPDMTWFAAGGLLLGFALYRRLTRAISR